MSQCKGLSLFVRGLLGCVPWVDASGTHALLSFSLLHMQRHQSCCSSSQNSWRSCTKSCCCSGLCSSTVYPPISLPPPRGRGSLCHRRALNQSNCLHPLTSCASDGSTAWAKGARDGALHACRARVYYLACSRADLPPVRVAVQYACDFGGRKRPVECPIAGCLCAAFKLLQWAGASEAKQGIGSLPYGQGARSRR